MSHNIVLAGDKGGSGKTTVSHALAHGLALHGVKTIHVTTDPRRVVLPADQRRYGTVDGRDVRALAGLIDSLARRSDYVLVIDGGASRPDVDGVLARVADLTLVPFGHSAEDLRVAVADLQRLSSAVGLPNRWPTQAWARQVAERELAAHLGELSPRLMSPLPDINGLTSLVQEAGPTHRINGPCRQLALRVLDRMRLSLFDFRAPKAA